METRQPIWRAVIEAELEPVNWSVQCNDWTDPSSDDFEQYLEEVKKVQKPGSIVLAHDNYADELIDNAFPGIAPTFSRGRLARKILNVIRDKGFMSCSLEQALLTGQPIRRPRLPFV